MIVKDHWRITTAAIQLEMERISGLLEKSARHQQRMAARAAAAPEAAAESAPASPSLAGQSR